MVPRVHLAVALLFASASGCATVAERDMTFDEGGIIRGDRTRKELALVFTGGEYGEGTGHVLDVLRRTGIRASFFVTGDFITGARQQAWIREMVEDGHYVGPHSDSHPLYCSWEERRHTLVDERFFRDDLQQNIEDLRRLGALGSGERVYFIPPYEWFNRDQVEWSARMGVTLFNFTPGAGSNRDWIPECEPGFVSSRQIRDDVLAYEQSSPDGLNGFLLLLHLGSARRDKMHLQLERLVGVLASRGYGFVRVNELLAQPRPPGDGASSSEAASSARR